MSEATFCKEACPMRLGSNFCRTHRRVTWFPESHKNLGYQMLFVNHPEKNKTSIMRAVDLLQVKTSRN